MRAFPHRRYWVMATADGLAGFLSSLGAAYTPGQYQTLINQTQIPFTMVAAFILLGTRYELWDCFRCGPPVEHRILFTHIPTSTTFHPATCRLVSCRGLDTDAYRGQSLCVCVECAQWSICTYKYRVASLGTSRNCIPVRSLLPVYICASSYMRVFSFQEAQRVFYYRVPCWLEYDCVNTHVSEH